MTKSRRTRERIALHALELFEQDGFDATTVAQVAAAAGVTEMTVYRHFPAKEQLVLDDPYDPVIAAAVAEQPRTRHPLARTVGGLRQAWRALPEPSGDIVHRKVRVVAGSSSLRAASWRNNAATELLIVDQLVTDGTDELTARVAASAALAALLTALFVWADRDDLRLTDVVESALNTLDGGRG